MALFVVAVSWVVVLAIVCFGDLNIGSSGVGTIRCNESWLRCLILMAM